MTFDARLRAALRRQEPPEGFAERTLERLARGERPPSPRSSAPRAGRTRWLAAAAAVLLLLGGTAEWFRAEQRRAAQAKREVELGLRLASEKIHEVQVRLQALGGPGQR